MEKRDPGISRFNPCAVAKKNVVEKTVDYSIVINATGGELRCTNAFNINVIYLSFCLPFVPWVLRIQALAD